ncbi:hypothetical protein [Exiguobacterium acetylicum]|uniref:hypothetical protein n=1 Tax=Exiguobacterium acetylicum TaxID=41170 RepID=UPI000680236E|nr:hypothetical protein [Exiguobacterium acetylicum]KNH34726.1 hypothetical protein ACS74_09475 [Exiguobacterium acetylicum]
MNLKNKVALGLGALLLSMGVANWHQNDQSKQIAKTELPYEYVMKQVAKTELPYEYAVKKVAKTELPYEYVVINKKQV